MSQDQAPKPFDEGGISPLAQHDIAVRLLLCSPDDVNEAGRNAGLPLQAVSLTVNGDTILLSWPPDETTYGYKKTDLYRDLGKELIENVLRLSIDKS